VNIIKESILKTRQKTSSNLESVLCNNKEAKMEPKACPRKTMLPNNPKALLSNPNSCFINTEHAGRTPLSKFVNRFAKNYILIKLITTYLFMSGGKYIVFPSSKSAYSYSFIYSKFKILRLLFFIPSTV